MQTNAQALNYAYFQLPIIGTITALDKESRTIGVRTRSENVFVVHVKDTTWFDAVKNLDRIDRRRPRQMSEPDCEKKCYDNLRVGDLLAVEGTYSLHNGEEVYEALAVHELISHAGYYHFEHTFWWIGQINALADRWMDNLFGDRSVVTADDFATSYRTALNIQGEPHPNTDDRQEMATLARLIYGFASAYLITGEERFFYAAKEGVAYQREAFRSISSDGRFCFWVHARCRDANGRFDILASLFDDDVQTLPLYEQIYALAGLAQYFRITQDWEVLTDIKRTIAMFNHFYADPPEMQDKEQVGENGYYSHIDEVEFSPHADKLDERSNKSQKNWNSIGDHLPAYLINLMIALDPLPTTIGSGDTKEDQTFAREINEFSKTCRKLLDNTARLIMDKFPMNDSKYVNERFNEDWSPNHHYRWQQNRGIVGHNLKIAWNLTRVANYYSSHGEAALADKAFGVALKLGKAMAELGIDQMRSGVYDAVERNPNNGMPTQFPWLNTRDFWQQEQGILAYLIMFGRLVNEHGAENEDCKDFLQLARELQAYWNLYFLDHDRNGVYFRVSDNGTPVIKGTYGDKGGHSISGYHVFELAYLAHIYQRVYMPRQKRHHSGLVLYFWPDKASPFSSLNVLPDFVAHDNIEVQSVNANGVPRARPNSDQPYTIQLHAKDMGAKILIQFQQTQKLYEACKPLYTPDSRPD